MTVEKRIVDELKAERAAVPAFGPGARPESRSPWPRRLMVAAVAMLLLAGGSVAGLVGPPGQVAEGPDEVALGPIIVPVTGEKISVGGVTMDVAAPAPGLHPTVEIPGTEVALDQSGPPGEAHLPNDTDGPMVYVGTVAGQAVVLHDDNPPVAGLGEELASFVSRITDGPMFCANTDGCSHATGEPLLGLGHSRTGLSPFTVTVTGWDLPAATAAVLVTTGDGAGYWQRPAGRSMTIIWEQPAAPKAPFTFVGVDPAGKEIFRETLG